MLTIILNFVLPVALYVVVLRAGQAHDAEVRRASQVEMTAEAPSRSVNAAPTGGSVNAAAPAAEMKPKTSFFTRAFAAAGGLLRTPSNVDRRLEALGLTHADVHIPGKPLGHLHDEVLVPVPLTPIADALLDAGDKHSHLHDAGGELRVAPPADGEREEVEDSELVPFISGHISPVGLAYAIGAFSIALNIVTLALQIDGAAQPSR